MAMDAKDWYDCGVKIGDLVQNAIDRQNFQSLNEAIMNTISQAVDSAVDSVQPNAGSVQRQAGPARRNAAPTYRSRGNAYQKARSDAHVREPWEQESQRGGASGANRSAKGIFSMVAGYGMAILTGVLTLTLFFLSLISGIGFFRIGAFFFMILTAVFAIVGARGGGYRSRMKQLERYLKIMDGRDVVTVQELASGTGKTEKEVREDLKAMIRDGMFASEAYLDPQGTNLMTSRKAYRQYQETMHAYEERRKEQEEKRLAAAGSVRDAGAVKRSSQNTAAAEDDLRTYSEETRKILQDGRDFISHIHACNDLIPEAEMTEKLDTLERVVSRIFEQVAANPDSAPDLHRMMSYYLPVTKKLVDAYIDLGKAGTSGENVTKTRNEIEMSLDTINLAFETFLDGFYQDTAWDISSDISAMKTMMARDGLTNAGDFGRTRSVGRDMKASESAGSNSGTDKAQSVEAQKPQAVQAAAGAGGMAAAVMKEEE